MIVVNLYYRMKKVGHNKVFVQNDIRVMQRQCCLGLQPLAHCYMAVNPKGQVISHYVSNSKI